MFIEAFQYCCTANVKTRGTMNSKQLQNYKLQLATLSTAHRNVFNVGGKISFKKTTILLHCSVPADC